MRPVSAHGLQRIGKGAQRGLDVGVGMRQREIHFGPGDHEDAAPNHLESEPGCAFPIRLAEILVRGDPSLGIDEDRRR